MDFHYFFGLLHLHSSRLVSSWYILFQEFDPVVVFPLLGSTRFTYCSFKNYLWFFFLYDRPEDSLDYFWFWCLNETSY